MTRNQTPVARVRSHRNVGLSLPEPAVARLAELARDQAASPSRVLSRLLNRRLAGLDVCWAGNNGYRNAAPSPRRWERLHYKIALCEEAVSRLDRAAAAAGIGRSAVAAFMACESLGIPWRPSWLGRRPRLTPAERRARANRRNRERYAAHHDELRARANARRRERWASDPEYRARIARQNRKSIRRTDGVCKSRRGYGPAPDPRSRCCALCLFQGARERCTMFFDEAADGFVCAAFRGIAR